MSHVFRCSGYDLAKTGIVHGQGSCLYDAQGQRYVDFEAGVWCLSLGDNHSRINKALTEQQRRIGL